MLLKLIQSLLLFALCNAINGSQKAEQQAIVRSWNNEKLIENWSSTTPYKSTRSHIEPLSNIPFHRLTMRANHIRELCERGKTEQAYNSYAKIAPHLPEHLFLFNQKAQKATQSIHTSIQQIEKEKIIGCDVLKDIDYSEHPEIEIACQFLSNYGDDNLSAEDAAKKFIQTITSQKGLSRTISEIAKTPICANVTRKLQAASLEKNDPLIPHFYYVLAELHYKSKNYIQAHTFYTKSNITYLKEKKVTANAFLAYIVATSTFDKNSLIYLTSLIGNIGNQLKKMDTIDQTISYHIALLTQTVIEHNPMMNIEEKKALLLNGLQHLTYAQKNTNLTVQFHTLLATIYEEQNDIAISLKHTKNGLKNNEIAAILTHAEKVNPELYNRCASWTKIVLDYIEGRQQTNKQKNHILLPQFVASDLCAQLLSYCEQTPTTKKIFNNDMCSLLALNNKNKKNYALARHYIDKLIDPISADALFLKASIYATTHKTLSDTEFETVIKQYINNKKPSLDAYQTIISLLKRHHPFFMQKNNYKFAGKLISKISEQHNSTAEIIRLAYEIGSWLYTTQNEYLQQWYKELDACQFYNKIQDPSYYDSDTNALIGVLFMKQTSFSSYKKIISYFTTALESTNLSPENSQQLRNTCRILYFKWAQSMYHDGKEALHLFDLAIQYDPTDDSQYEKAYFILHNSDNKDLILYALELLEDIFQKNGRSKELAQQELALAYLNYSSNPVQIDTIRQCIPLDIDKALTYLQAHNNNKELLECIINILSGVCNYIEPIFTEKYKNLEEALTYTNIAIETNPDNIDYIAHRMILHRDLHNPTKAIEDIDLLLNHDLTNTDISQQHLLWAKAILLFDTSDEAKYDKALECIRQLQSWNKNKITVIDLSPKMLVYINTLIANQNMSDDAVEWCCLAADMEIIKENVASQNPTTEQKELAHYLLAAAEIGNIHAQLIVLHYTLAINYQNIGSLNHIKSLSYSHKALLHPNSKIHTLKIDALIKPLRLYSESGVALAYYILCDYYKKDPQNLEKIMLLFNKIEKQFHWFEDTSDIIETIGLSCRDMLIPYIKRCMESKLSKRTLIDALAAYTLGSMYQYSNQDCLISMGKLYLTVALETLYNKFKLTHYKTPIEIFVARNDYKKALVKEQTTNITDVELLRNSAKFGVKAAAHKLARIYIEQHKNGTFNVVVNVDDFLPVLIQDMITKKPHPDSITLFKEFSMLAAHHKIRNNNAPQKK